MNEKHAYEAGQTAPQRVDVTAARVAADTRRRWDEVRQAREQVMSRQEQVIQQTRADVRRHVERMRNVRAAIITPEPPRTTAVVKSDTAVAVKSTAAILTPIAGPRFDFDARRVAWEQRRKEQAEKRRAEIERLNEPYQAQRRMLEEKRRQALLDQQAARQPHVVGAHQFASTSKPQADTGDVETVIAINVVIEDLAPKALTAVAPVEPAAKPGVSSVREYRQHCLFAEEA